jgi:SAM-dependent methyltransferase
MSNPFAGDYARQYDRLYADKDYEAECDLIESASSRYGVASGRRLLDVGCGTGGHAIRLAQRGWNVCGVDRSPAMLAIARAKASVPLELVEGDAQTFDAGGSYDVALMMFAVLGYLHENAAVLQALRNIRRHLVADALLIFDCWYGPAVLAQRPGDRMRVIENGDSRTTRFAHGTLNSLRHLATIRYRILEIAGDRVIADAEEVHAMRYFFPQELRLFLEDAGYEMLSIGAFPSLDTPPTDADWNALVIARARRAL